MSLSGVKGGKSLSSVLCENCGNDNLPEACFCYYCGSQLMTLSVQPTPAITQTVPLEQPQVAWENVGFGPRFLAAIIDGVIITGIGFMFIRSVFWGLPVLIFWIILACFYHWLLVGFKGQTVGKMAVGIRVVKDDGTAPGLGYAALREIIGKFISTLAFFIGFIWLLFDPNKQGWHDYIAQTFVARVK